MKVSLYTVVVMSFLFYLIGMTAGALAHDNAGWMFISCLAALVGMILALASVPRVSQAQRRVSKERDKAQAMAALADEVQRIYVMQVYPGDEEDAKAVLEYQKNLERNRGNQ